MKNAMKKLPSVILIVLVTLVNANAKIESLDIKISDNRSFQICAKNVVGQAQLKIVDSQGTTLYKSLVENNGSYTKTFDVSKLPFGNYTLLIEDEFKTKTVALEIYENIFLDLDQVRTQLNPIITGFDNKVTVSIHAVEHEKMTISIYDEAGNVIEFNTLKGEGYIGKKFNLKSLDAGTYIVSVNHKGRTFRKQLVI